MKTFIKNNIKEIINYIIVFIIIILEIILILFTLLKVEAKALDNEPIEIKKENIIEEDKNIIKVEIKGQINNPGVYEIEEGKRVIDVINIAGGLTENANTSIINLSKIVQDEMVIIIYSNEEIESYKKENVKIEYQTKIEYVYLEKECICPDNVNDSCIINENIYVTEEKIEKENKEENLNEEKSELININTADIEQLTTLDGIGKSKAEKIIEYRNTNGNFKNIEELTNVNGIGNAIIEKIKNKITI